MSGSVSAAIDQILVTCCKSGPNELKHMAQLLLFSGPEPAASEV